MCRQPGHVCCQPDTPMKHLLVAVLVRSRATRQQGVGVCPDCYVLTVSCGLCYDLVVSDPVSLVICWCPNLCLLTPVSGKWVWQESSCTSVLSCKCFIMLLHKWTAGPLWPQLCNGLVVAEHLQLAGWVACVWRGRVGCAPSGALLRALKHVDCLEPSACC